MAGDGPEGSTGARLAELAELHGLTARQMDLLGRLLVNLAGDPHAPTAVREAHRAVDVHLADSLAALQIDGLRGAHRVVDIGAGAGFPGIPLAIAQPQSELHLLESQGRKCAFMVDALDRLGMSNAKVVCARVEDWEEGRRATDAVLARAVAAQPVVLEYAAPLLRIGGTLVDWRGRRVEEEEDAAARAAEALGLHRSEIRRVEPFPGASDHHLHVFMKLDETPPRYPRRAGIARKRPLGARQHEEGDRR